ncbi:MAG: hypothetical protein ACXAC5_05375 [Promethearchaeota archaeon]|jgi:hypothetical protein
MIVVFEAETHPHTMSPAVEFFEFDEYTLGALLNEYLESWCDANPDIVKDSAYWYKVEVTNGNERFEG